MGWGGVGVDNVYKTHKWELRGGYKACNGSWGVHGEGRLKFTKAARRKLLKTKHISVAARATPEATTTRQLLELTN